MRNETDRLLRCFKITEHCCRYPLINLVTQSLTTVITKVLPNYLPLIYFLFNCWAFWSCLTIFPYFFLYTLAVFWFLLTLLNHLKMGECQKVPTDKISSIHTSLHNQPVWSAGDWSAGDWSAGGDWRSAGVLSCVLVTGPVTFFSYWWPAWVLARPCPDRSCLVWMGRQDTGIASPLSAPVGSESRQQWVIVQVDL